MRTTLAFALTSLAVSGLNAQAAQKQHSIEWGVAHVRSLEVEIFKALVAKAMAGNWVPQFAVSYIYGAGSGVPKDSSKTSAGAGS